MYKSKLLRGVTKRYLLPVCKKLGILPESLVLFRIAFAIFTAFSIAFFNFKIAVVVLFIYQIVFLVDYIDGELAKYYKSFSIKWNIFDRGAHYVVSMLFLLAAVLTYSTSSINLILGLLGSGLIIVNLIAEQIWLRNKGISLDKLRGPTEKQGILSPIYSFLPIDGPFTIFFFLFVFKFFSILIVFYSLLYLATLINKIFILSKHGKGTRNQKKIR